MPEPAGVVADVSGGEFVDLAGEGARGGVVAEVGAGEDTDSSAVPIPAWSINSRCSRTFHVGQEGMPSGLRCPAAIAAST